MSGNPWFEAWVQAWALSVEIPTVIALRSLRIARGGGSGGAEARLMVSEKLATLAALQGLAVTGKLGKTPVHVAAAVIAHCAPKVRANRRRLTKRR